MTIIENFWIALTIVIILFVLSTDPKTSGSGNNQASIISSVSERQINKNNYMDSYQLFLRF